MSYYNYELKELYLNGLWHWEMYPEDKSSFKIIY